MPIDPLAWIDDELQQLAAAGLRTNIRTLESPMDAWVTIERPAPAQFLRQQLPRPGQPPAPAPGSQRCHRPLRRRSRRRAHDRRHDLAPRRAGRTAGGLQARRSLHHPPKRLHGQPGHHPGAGRAGRRHLLRRTQPRQHHRCLPPEPRHRRPLCAQRRGRPAAAHCGDAELSPPPDRERRRLQHGRRYRTARPPVRRRRRTRHYPDGGRRPRRRRARPGRARHRRPLWPARPCPCRSRHAEQGLWRGRRPGRRAQVDRRLAAPARPARSSSPAP